MKQHNVLLEAGTNELEIMILELGGVRYGVNVAKVREVILPRRVHALPAAPPTVEGVIQLRGTIVELVDLRDYLGMGPFTDDERDDPTQSQILVTEFNEQVIGFRVQKVLNITRASWEDIAPVPEGCQDGYGSLVAVAILGGDIVQMLDLESIVFAIKPEMRMQLGALEEDASRGDKHIVIAEDSPLIRATMVRQLHGAGYKDTADFSNGLDAWTYLDELASKGERCADLVVSDIEMPRLDGLHLCKRIRSSSNAQLAGVPVVLFSSLVTDQNRNKGEQVGATEQLAKPQLGELVCYVDKFTNITPAEPAG